jgi:hypothetical protein
MGCNTERSTSMDTVGSSLRSPQANCNTASTPLTTLRPVLFKAREPFPAGPRQRVPFCFTPKVRNSPAGAHPAVLLHAVQRGVKRAFFDLSGSSHTRHMCITIPYPCISRSCERVYWSWGMEQGWRWFPEIYREINSHHGFS